MPDQVKGDGSIDIKSRSDYITSSYNHFWDSGKACVAGGVWESKNPDDPEAKVNITYHHNWFDHSDSRHPRCVAGNTHVYNNYYDGVAKYGHRRRCKVIGVCREKLFQELSETYDYRYSGQRRMGRNPIYE